MSSNHLKMAMSNRNRIQTFSHISMVILFLFACYLPLSKTLITPTQSISETEKRKLAPPPKLEMKLENLKSFPRQFENYYKDHFGFRSFLIFCNSYICHQWLGVSPVPSILIGKEGWLFWNRNRLNEDFRGVNPMTSWELEQWKNVLEDRAEWLAREGIPYLFFISPEKQTIYPEFLPDHLQQRKGMTRLTQLEDYLKQNSTIRLPDLKTPLRLEKEKHVVYYKTDTHWNFRGGLTAYQTLMEPISVWFPDITARPKSFFTERMSADHIGGDLALSMELQGVLREDRPVFQPEYLCAKRWAYETPLAPRGIYAMGCKTETRKAVVFRDSYFNFILPFLSEHFREVIYVWDQYNHELCKQLIRDVQPDVVIEEMLERFLVYEAQDQEGWKNIRLDLAQDRFERSERVLYYGKNPDLSGISPAQDLVEFRQPGQTVYRSTGVDPQLQLPDCIPETAGSLIFRIRITSPSETEIQVFYRTGGEPSYSEVKSVKTELRRGVNEVYLPVTGRDYSGAFRLDPGKTPGDYILHEIEIRDTPRNPGSKDPSKSPCSARIQ